jgi:hypothetical protein
MVLKEMPPQGETQTIDLFSNDLAPPKTAELNHFSKSSQTGV